MYDLFTKITLAILQADQKTLATLQLFAYGSYPEYAKNKAKYIELNEKQLTKLKLITLADMAAKAPIVTY